MAPNITQSSLDNTLDDVSPEVLKTDLFGQIRKEFVILSGRSKPIIVRDVSQAKWWLRFVARKLAKREATVLSQLPQHLGLPNLASWDGQQLQRSYVAGQPMQQIKPRDKDYFKSARQLLRVLHRAGVVHNDTAKEPNWLVLPDGSAGLVDFQLAAHFPRRNKLFRSLAREDLRHLLKHKRSYRPDLLTKRELNILNSPALFNRAWKHTGKRLYILITRRVLKWSDREGANDRRF